MICRLRKSIPIHSRNRMLRSIRNMLTEIITIYKTGGEQPKHIKFSGLKYSHYFCEKRRKILLDFHKITKENTQM